MSATLSQILDLVLQASIFIMVWVGYIFFRKKKYIWHAQLMTIAFFMILVSFLLVMLPSLIMTYNTFLDPATTMFDTSSIIHIPLGTAGLLTGGFLVVRWARNDFTLTHIKAPRLMWSTAILWTSNVVIGAIIFFTMSS
jgi:uncharacterized membrane protein YozB (DUF420 family)